MTFQVGDRVVVTNDYLYGGEYNDREAVYTGDGMLASEEGLPKHFVDGDRFHLRFRSGCYKLAKNKKKGYAKWISEVVK
jgi:hypothetical protein